MGRRHLVVLDEDNLIWELSAWGKVCLSPLFGSMVDVRCIIMPLPVSWHQRA